MSDNATGVTELTPELEAQIRAWQFERSNTPREYYNALQAKCPVDTETHLGVSANPIEVPLVAVLKRADIEHMLRTPEIFSTQMPKLGSAEPLIPLGVDPPLQSQYRRVLDPLFSPKVVAKMQPDVAAVVNELIDQFIDQGEVDFSEGIAVPLPCTIFLKLIGLPVEELDMLVNWKNIMIRPDLAAGGIEAGRAMQATTGPEIYARMGKEMEIRRAEPRDDLITYFLNVELEDGRKLTDSEILRILFFFLAAGLDTITISLQAIFNFLATHPEAQQLIADDPNNVDNIIEELLRWETPVQQVTRVAKVDTEIAGCPIAAGTRVVASLSSGNVNIDDPESLELDLTRGDKAHLSFGAGNHRCLGSHLARMEMRTVLREWHKRIPYYSIKPGTKIEWVPSGLRGIDYLPLVWDAQKGSQ